MRKKLISELQKKLEAEKEKLQSCLQSFADKDKKLKDDWDTRFPSFDSHLEESADEVEEFETLLPIEHNLELKLQNVNSALEKIKKGKYGVCEKCKKPISEDRLKAYPEAKTCTHCKLY